MRILIVDDDIVSLNKLNQLVSRLGSGETVGNGTLAVRLFQLALKENRPYELVTLDIELPDIRGTDLLGRFREMEAQYPLANGGRGAYILMVTSHSDHETVLSSIQNKCNGYLVKPFNKERLDEALQAIGLIDSPTPAAERPASLSLPDRMSRLLETGLEMEENDFNHMLCRLVDEGGEKAEKLLVQYLTSNAGDRLTVRVVGIIGLYPRRAFLAPLKDLAERSTNFNLRKQAILSIAKQGDEHALKILTGLNEAITNTFLQKIVVSEINVIKQNKPYLSLIPQFMQGQKDIKTFKSIMKILKRILKPTDMRYFAVYLQEDDPVVRLGAWELLCEKGDPGEEEEMLFFLRRELTQAEPGRAESDDFVYQMLYQLEKFFVAQRPFRLPLYDDLREFFDRLEDQRIREIVLNLLLQYPEKNFAFEAIELYRQREDWREQLLPGLASSPAGMEFLFAELEEDHGLQNKILLALLQNASACPHFLRRAPRMERCSLILLLQSIPAHHYPLFRTLVYEQLQGKDPEIRQTAMERIRDNCDFEAAPLLFDPTMQPIFWEKTPNYFATIARLFPIQALHSYFEQIFSDEIPLTTINDWLDIIQRLLEYEPVLKIEEQGKALFEAFILQWLNAPASRHKTDLLQTFQKLRCLDSDTLTIFQAGLGFYIQKRAKNLTPEESQEIKKCREHFSALFLEVRALEDGYKEIKFWLDSPSVNFDLLEKIIVGQPQSFCLRRKEVMQKVTESLTSTSSPTSEGWARICRRFPLFRTHTSTSEKPEGQRSFCLFFEQKGLFALLQDQLKRIFPEFKVKEKEPAQPQDFLIADYVSFERLIGQEKPNALRNIVVLNNAGEFGAIKAHNPITLPAPMSLARIVRSVLQEFLG